MAPIKVVVSKSGSRIHFFLPYSETFLSHAHRLEGRWKKRSRVWSFDQRHLAELLEVCKGIYANQPVDWHILMNERNRRDYEQRESA